MWNQMLRDIIKGDFKTIARAISLIENEVPGYEELMVSLPQFKTPIIGITGPPGAGKSTFLRLIRGELWPAATNGGARRYGFDGEVTESPIGIKHKVALVSAEQQTRYMRTEWHMKAWQVVFTGLFDSELMYHHPTDEQLSLVRATLRELAIARWCASRRC